MTACPKRTRSLVLALWAAIGLLWLAAELSLAAGWRINHTASLPIGLWRLAPVSGDLRRGQIVTFCPPATELFALARRRGVIARGFCPGGYEPLLKLIVAGEGDDVAVSPEGIAVNGELIVNSAAIPGAFPHWPRGRYRTPPGAVWVISSFNAASFDSRYFGPIDAAAITGIATRW